MAMEDTFGNSFKPEVRSSGRKLFSGDKVSISSGSDTAIQAYVRVAPPFKVTLSSDEIDSTAINADCSCPVAKKSRFCKHIWATLLATEDRYPDFLIGKTEIDKRSAPLTAAEDKKTTYQETAKQRASDYRKAQYQKQKAHVKDKKNKKEGIETASSSYDYSPEEEAALAYFTLNGFPMPAGPDKDILAEAKRKLSRIFHPDKGGTHEESVELNQNCEILLRFIK
jgi:hypothetical protein